MMTQNYIFKIFFAFFILFTITPLVVGQFFGQDHFIRFAESFIFVWPILSTLYLLFFIIWIFIMEQQKKYFLIFLDILDYLVQLFEFCVWKLTKT